MRFERGLPGRIDLSFIYFRYLCRRQFINFQIFIYMGTDIKDSITTREKEILYLLSKGLNSKEIAAELFISAHTVEYHRRQLLKKTNYRNIAQLIGNAFRMGIL